MTGCEVHFRGNLIAKAAEAQMWEMSGATGLMLRGNDADKDGLSDAFDEMEETIELRLQHNGEKRNVQMNLAYLFFPDDHSYEAFLIHPGVTFDHTLD